MALHKRVGNGGHRFGVWTAISVAALIHFAHSATAQDWPTRPVTMVVPFAAGSASILAASLRVGTIIANTGID